MPVPKRPVPPCPRCGKMLFLTSGGVPGPSWRAWLYCPLCGFCGGSAKSYSKAVAIVREMKSIGK